MSYNRIIEVQLSASKLSAEDEILARLEAKSGKDKPEPSKIEPVPVAEDIKKFLKYNFSFVEDLPLSLSVEFGRTRVSVREFLNFKQGYVLELNKMAGEPLELYINGRLLARGEVVVTQEKFGIRLTDIIEGRVSSSHD